MQTRLDGNAIRRRATREKVAQSPLAGRIFDDTGRPMSPTFSYGRNGRLYRYYLRAAPAGRQTETGQHSTRISAQRLEAAISDALERLLPEHSDDPLARIERLEIGAEGVYLLLPLACLARVRPRLRPGEDAHPAADHPDSMRLSLPIHIGRKGGPPEIVPGQTARRRPDPVLVKGLRDAHAMLEQDRQRMPWRDDAPTSPHRRRLIRLAFLAPDLQRMILQGRHTSKLTLARLLNADIPLSWEAQRRLLEDVMID